MARGRHEPKVSQGPPRSWLTADEVLFRIVRDRPVENEWWSTDLDDHQELERGFVRKLQELLNHSFFCRKWEIRTSKKKVTVRWTAAK